MVAYTPAQYSKTSRWGKWLLGIFVEKIENEAVGIITLCINTVYRFLSRLQVKKKLSFLDQRV